MATPDPDDVTPQCPSAPARAGARLLGRFTAGGKLAFAATPLPVSGEFLAAAAEGGDVGKRFRFTSRCMESGCSRWVEGTCLVARAAVRAADSVDARSELPACPIRQSCRWFAQEGPTACRVCPHVVYDMRDVQPDSADGVESPRTLASADRR